MKKSAKFLILFGLIWIGISVINGQSVQGDNKQIWQSIIGNITAIDQPSGKATVRTDDKKDIKVTIIQKAVFLQIKSNEKTLENAEKISLSQVRAGARVLARGLYSENGAFNAQMIVVVSDEEITGDGNNQNAPIAGTVIAIDPAKKQIKARIVSQTGVKEIILDNISAEKTGFYRYANDSLKFNNSVASSFDKIKVGDQFKSTGKMSDDSAVFFPKTIVFGTFRTIGGKITSIDLNKREFTIEDIQTKKIVKIAISDETLLKILSEEKADELINTYFKNNNQTGERKNFKLFYDELSLIPTDRLAVGDNIIISAAVNDESAMTAFYLLKDVKPVFSYLEKQQKKGKPLPNLGGINL